MQELGEFRIIPAYAGSTRVRHHRRKRSADHPRLRGEHLERREVTTEEVGSSPPTRGAPEQHFGIFGGCRIIPAYAGSTNRDEKLLGPYTDHPRLRGEHVWSYYPLRDGNRIIPAYAGSTGE